MNGRTTTLYGIPNCDTVKKARSWLAAQGVLYEFHDFKKAGVSAELIGAWLGDVALETLLNRKGTTWRSLPEERKAAITDAPGATRLMIELPSLIKRPVLSIDDQSGRRTWVGFSDALYQQIFTR